MIKAGIIGANGYTGFELMRLLAAHPEAEVTFAASRSLAGHKVRETYPTLAGYYGDTEYREPDIAEAAKCDVVFACLPHGQSAEICGRLVDAGTRVIDLSADFRYDDTDLYEKTYGLTHPRRDLAAQAVYGLPEYNRAAIAKARLVANPGCFVTASVLAIKPLADAGVINKRTVIVDAKSGVSGAGRKADVAYNANEVEGNFKAYGVTTHRHTTEIEEKCGAVVTFTPHLLPIKRGILATIYCDLTADPKKAVEAYARYNGEPFVHFTGADLPEIKTKSMKSLLDTMEAGKSVVITEGVKTNVVLSARNLPGVKTTPANILSVYDLLNAKSLVVDKAALAVIEEVYA